jgi:lipopolysaccharide assembly outer membrane protein LptD (OstA)
MRNNYTFSDVKIEPHQDPIDTTLFIPASHVSGSENEFSWTAGAATSMNLYGTFYPNIGTLRGIRHTMQPSASYSYRPGRDGRPSSQVVSVSLNNSFDIKVRGKEDESEPRKLSGVLIWALNSSYNPAAPSKQGWSTISSRVNLRAIGTTFSLNNTIHPYSLDILTTSVTSSFVIRGTHSFGSSAEAAQQELNVAASDTSGASEKSSYTIEETRAGQDPDGEEGLDPSLKDGMAWMVAATFSYSKAQVGDPRSTLNLNANFSLTRNWRVTYRTTYDIQGRELLGQFFSLARDLHCWEISFNRQELIGGEWNFYFKISLKAHPELYAEQGDRGLGTGTFGSPFRY